MPGIEQALKMHLLKASVVTFLCPEITFLSFLIFPHVLDSITELDILRPPNISSSTPKKSLLIFF